MSTVICHMQECKYNGGTFCQKQFTIINGGICSELVDKDGRRKNPESWIKPGLLHPEQSQK